ncbi:MAG: hypothetical protein WCX84_06140 [Syntrophales bacterium]|nr:hypothetical protein [Syntrophales bacterium]
MTTSHFRRAIAIIPLERSKFRQVFGQSILLTLCMLSLLVACPCLAKADPWRGNYEEPLLTYPTQVFMYPRAGQPPMQQDRDRYECHIWAMGQSGFDPSLPFLPVHRPVRVEPMPPVGHDTTSLAFTGALLGAIIGGHHHTGRGALIGGVIGAMAGLASDSARAQTARRIEEEQSQRYKEYDSHMEKRASDYRRAMGACLEGRGYGVK